VDVVEADKAQVASSLEHRRHTLRRFLQRRAHVGQRAVGVHARAAPQDRRHGHVVLASGQRRVALTHAKRSRISRTPKAMPAAPSGLHPAATTSTRSAKVT
jgi:hypothetical protein